MAAPYQYHVTEDMEVEVVLTKSGPTWIPTVKQSGARIWFRIPSVPVSSTYKREGGGLAVKLGVSRHLGQRIQNLEDRIKQEIFRNASTFCPKLRFNSVESLNSIFYSGIWQATGPGPASGPLFRCIYVPNEAVTFDASGEVLCQSCPVEPGAELECIVEVAPVWKLNRTIGVSYK
ncbi:hypothetical protein HK102_011967, partial [Quaeritorhiza haematococci]